MKVSDIIRTNGVRLKESSTLIEMARLMASSDEKIFPVLNDKGEITGIVNPKSILKMMLPGYFDILYNFNFIDDFEPLENIFCEQLDKLFNVNIIIVKDIMKTKLFKIDKDISILKAMATLVSNNIEFLPVVDDKIYIGYVTEKDIIKYTLTNLKTNICRM